MPLQISCGIARSQQARPSRRHRAGSGRSRKPFAARQIRTRKGWTSHAPFRAFGYNHADPRVTLLNHFSFPRISPLHLAAPCFLSRNRLLRKKCSGESSKVLAETGSDYTGVDRQSEDGRVAQASPILDLTPEQKYLPPRGRTCFPNGQFESRSQFSRLYHQEQQRQRQAGGHLTLLCCTRHDSSSAGGRGLAHRADS